MSADHPPAVTRTYRALKGLAWIVIAVFYRRIDVTGDDELRVARPTVIVANHTNNLADPVVILAKMPGHPRFLAAGSWWKFAPARWLFRLAGVVPIFRPRDGGGSTANRSSFAACHEALAHGATLALFPEGEVNREPSILPVKTGAARIVLGATVDAGVSGVVVVPVGVSYDDRARFRSQAAVQVGPPIPVDRFGASYREEPRAVVRALTAEIETALRAVTVNHDTWEDFRLVDRAATLALADSALSERGYTRRNELRRRLAGRMAPARRDAARWQELADAVAAHERELDGLGLDPARPIPVERRVAQQRRRVAAQLVALAPAAGVGAVTNFPVALGIRGAAAVVRDASWQATVKGVAGLGLCPIAWGTEAFLVRRHGRRAVLTTLAVAPVGGLAWIAWRERRRQWRQLEREAELLDRRPDEVVAASVSRSRVRVLVDAFRTDAAEVLVPLGAPTRAAVGSAGERADHVIDGAREHGDVVGLDRGEHRDA